MRIPSDFNDDNLYRRSADGRGRRRRGETASAYRRIVRLAIGLALVVVVMKQASQESVYQPFFGSSSTGYEATMLAGVNGDPNGELSSGPSGGASLGRNPGQPTASIPRPLRSDDLEALGRVVDGSVWRAEDLPAIRRFLAEAADLQSRGEVPPSAVVSVVPLLQQPEVYRGQWVRISGTVARVQRVPIETAEVETAEVESAEVEPSKTEPAETPVYYQIWIRPSDGAERPIVAITGQIPNGIEKTGDSPRDTTAEPGPDVIAEFSDARSGPPIVVVGRFIKRLAYRSGAGADLAPVVIGQWLRPVAPTTGLDESVSSQDQASTVRWTIGLAALAGLAIAGLAMWRTSVAAQQSRQLRAAQLADAPNFLRESDFLGKPDHDAAAQRGPLDDE